MAAITGILANPHSGTNIRGLADTAFAVADAMLAERDK
jgi:hypothetical protein